MNGSKLRKKRNEKGFLQEELAEKVGISRGFLSSVENEKSNPSLALLARIARELDCSVSDFF